jgi:hypothetical protein
VGGGSRLCGENPLHPERHPRHGGRGSSFRSCRNGNLVPRPEVVGGRFLAERAFKSLENAKKYTDENPGYSVFDESGKAVYTRAGAMDG